MKRRILVLLLMLIVSSLIPIISLTATASEMDTIVTYSKPAPPDPVPSPPAASYEIVIPTLYSLNDGNLIRITANNVSLNDGQALMVYVDGKSFAEDGYLHIISENSDVIRTALLRGNYVTNQEEPVSPGSAVFRYTNFGVDPAFP